ncbi:MAG: PAS domain S-box protein, partial [Halobaculum sp.]
MQDWSDEPIRVLHVDDDESFGSLVARSLPTDGTEFSVTTETSVRAGLSRLRREEFDCVVSDYNFPDRDGIEFLEEIRAEFDDLPFVLYTGRGSEAVASEAISAGVTDYIQKETGTAQFDVLRNRIENAVSQYRARQAAERTERQYHRLIEASTDVIAIVDTDGTFEYLSPAVEQILGYEPAELLGESCFDYLHPAHRETARDSLSDLLAGDPAVLPSRFEVRTKEGSWTWVEIRARDLRDDPAVGGVVVYARDISRRKHREERLSALFETTRDLVAADGVTGVASEMVRAAEDILDLHVCSVYRATGDTLEPVVATDDAESLFETIPVLDVADSVAGTVYQSGEPAFEDDVRSRSDVANPDTPVRSELVLPIGDFGVYMAASTEVGAFSERDKVLAQLLVSNAESVIDRVRQESVVRTQKEKLERLQARVRQLMTTETRAETARVAVEAASDVIGARRNGVHLRVEDGDTLDGVAVADEVREAFDGAPAYERDAEAGTADAVVWDAFERGESLSIEDLAEFDRIEESSVSRSALLYPVGDHGVFIGSWTEPAAYTETDETLFELLAAALETALDRVEREQALLERTAELEAQNERLDEFTSVVSHDLRNPLNVATGNLDLLRSECDSEYIDAVEQAHDRMAALIDDLLTIAYQDTSDPDTTRVVLDLMVTQAEQTVDTDDLSDAVED